jgi:hypothetical protein
MIDKGTYVLQNCTAFQKIEPRSSSETCPTPCDENQIVDIKVEEGPVPITFPGIKAEHEVSCMSVCPFFGTFHKYAESGTVFFFQLSLCIDLST